MIGKGEWLLLKAKRLPIWDNWITKHKKNYFHRDLQVGIPLDTAY